LAGTGSIDESRDGLYEACVPRRSEADRRRILTGPVPLFSLDSLPIFLMVAPGGFTDPKAGLIC